ncbi:MAG: acyl carrier protein [Lachnospiraceae bacterium]|nr:acyl carrier protein [Lachnospiraceae bacterium]
MSFDKVKEVIMDTLNCDEDTITREAKLKEDMGIDSLDAMELCIALEEAYDISIEEEALAGFVTVQNIVSYIDAKAA